MYIRVLGSAAGGGYPQWNCNHPNSRRVRAGDPAAPQRTQSSIAVSCDERHWLLCNASPDLRQQINDNPVLQPAADGPLRASPIQAVVLTNADVDHVTGLLSLRESQAFNLYATRRVLDVLAANSIFNVLNPAFVQRHPVALDQSFEPSRADGVSLGCSVTAFAVPGKVALWLEDTQRGVDVGAVTEDTVALEIREEATGQRFYYIPGCARMTPELAARLRGASLVFFVMGKTGSRMGHVNMSGADGSLAALAALDVKRKIYVHINNSNPVLDEHSDAYATVQAAGWEVGEDGMEVTL